MIIGTTRETQNMLQTARPQWIPNSVATVLDYSFVCIRPRLPNHNFTTLVVPCCIWRQTVPIWSWCPNRKSNSLPTSRFPQFAGCGSRPPPSDGVNLWTDAATKQKRHWRSRGLEILFNCVKRLAKKTNIKSILEGKFSNL